MPSNKEKNAVYKTKKFKPEKKYCLAGDDEFIGGEYVPGLRNEYLYTDKDFNYFSYYASTVGEQGRINPLDPDEARLIFLSLPTKRKTETEAFPTKNPRTQINAI